MDTNTTPALSYSEYRFSFIRFVDGSAISRLSVPILACSVEAAIADLEDAYDMQITFAKEYDID